MPTADFARQHVVHAFDGTNGTNGIDGRCIFATRFGHGGLITWPGVRGQANAATRNSRRVAFAEQAGHGYLRLDNS